MKFEKGNTASVKWTLESAEAFCVKVLDYIKENEKCRSMAKACSELGSYETQINYLVERFKNESEFKSIKEAKEIIKGRLIEQGLDNKVNSTMAIFILKNNHDMADKVEQKQDLNVNSVNLKDLVKFGD